MIKRLFSAFIVCTLGLVSCGGNGQEECANAPMTSSIYVVSQFNQAPLNSVFVGNEPAKSAPVEETVNTIIAQEVRVPFSGNTAIGYRACSIESMDTCKQVDVKPVSIPPFLIDALPVTNEEIDKCVKDGMCVKTESIKWAEESGADVSEPKHPAVVGYELAEEYCNAMGKSLPTEEQWLAAAMANGISKYTWGDEFFETASVSIQLFQFSKLENVGSMPRDQINGVYDLSGNGYEWIKADVLLGNRVPNVACDVQDSRKCLGAAPLPLYQMIGINKFGLATFRCIKNE